MDTQENKTENKQEDKKLFYEELYWMFYYTDCLVRAARKINIHIKEKIGIVPYN